MKLVKFGPKSSAQLTLFPFIGFKKNGESLFIGQLNSKQVDDLHPHYK